MIKIIEKNRGFVVLFAITLSAIFFSVALGVSNIALKQSKFSTSAEDTNEAFFAADTGVEYYYYIAIKNPASFCTYTSGIVPCPDNPYSVPDLGSTGNNCARVDIEKSTQTYPPPNGNQYVELKITSKGYNVTDTSCPPAADSVEREIIAKFAM